MTPAKPLGMQLYSGRKFPPVASQLATIAHAGFTNVEPFGPFYDDIEATRGMLGVHGFSVFSGHFSLAMLEEETARAISAAKRLGIAIFVAPYLLPDRRPDTKAGWQAMGARLSAIAATLGEVGLRFAWHNHDFKFRPLEDGSLPIEHLLGEDLCWEADLAWVVRGGADPRKWLLHYRGRVPLVHVKDIAPLGANAEEDGWADPGAGVLRSDELWPLCVAAGAEAMVAEHDNPSDFERFARVSAAAMRACAGGDR
jgi:sugar phosphate isomerase/epimerase